MTVTANGLQARYVDETKLDLPTITASARYRFHHFTFSHFTKLDLPRYRFHNCCYTFCVVGLAGSDMKNMQIQRKIRFSQKQYCCLKLHRVLGSKWHLCWFPVWLGIKLKPLNIVN